MVSDAKVWESFDASNRYLLVTSQPREKSAQVFTRLLMRVFSIEIVIFESRCGCRTNLLFVDLFLFGNATRPSLLSFKAQLTVLMQAIRNIRIGTRYEIIWKFKSRFEVC